MVAYVIRAKVKTQLFQHVIWCRRIGCEQVCSRINYQLIAGHFGYEGLRGRNVLQSVVD